jgi:WD40 repeat protein
MADKPTIRIFISSPADVRPERLLAERIVARLDREFGYHLRVEAVLWEREPLVVTHHFQDPENIPEPSGTDVVVVILWSRLGLLLPQDQYRGAISGRPVTGTEWEFEDALKAARAGGVPELLLYRKTKKVTVSLDDDVELERQREQKRLVEDFMGRWFGGGEGPLRAASRSFETTQQFEEMLYDHLRELLERRVDAGQSSAATWHDAPFRGLLPFELEHADIFFGRTRARNEVRESLADLEARGAAFVLVMGPSGCGKSSLVKAGVLPDLMLPGMIGSVALCRVAALRPSDGSTNLVETLAGTILDGALPELGALQYGHADLASLLVGGSQQATLALRQGLAEASKAQNLTANGQARLLVIIDQLEEMFTMSGVSDGERMRFVAALDALARSGLAWVVATMRSDFFDRLGEIPTLAALAGGEARYLLLAPTDAELGQMIREPARVAGLRFEVNPHDGTSLDERIREAASRREALPLLSFVLNELWKHRTDQGVLTIAAYDELGGLEGALAQRAEDEFRRQSPEVQAALPRVLRALAIVDAAGHIASKAAPLSMFPVDTPERRLIGAFSSQEARLFVSGDEDASEPRVRVAHEALLTHWKRAQEYLDANRADLQLEARLTEEAARYERGRASDRRSLLLPRGLRLEEAADLMRRRAVELSAPLIAYITRSVDAEKAATRFRGVAIVAVIVALGAFGVFSFLERNHALVVQSRFLARDSQTAVDDGDAVRGMLLALEALPRRIGDWTDRPLVGDAEYALENALANQRELLDLGGHKDAVESAAFSPDGRRIVSASIDGAVRVWDVRTGAQIAVMRSGLITMCAAFSPDGRRIVSASWDQSVRVWDAGNGAQIAVLRGHELSVNSAAFSPDGRRIVSASTDGTVRVWDARTGAPIAVLRGHTYAVSSAAFSPDSRRIVSASYDKTVRVWDARTGAQIMLLRGHENSVVSAAFSPDGRRIVSASPDRTVRVWDSVSGKPIAVLRGAYPVDSAAFSPDGRHIVSASDDGSVRIWDMDLPAPIAVLRGHEDRVTSAVFSPDGRRIVSASSDGTVRVWFAALPAQLAVLRGHEDFVASAAFSPDGRRIVTASWDKTVRVWDAGTGAQLAVLRGHEDRVASAAFSPDGRRIVSASDDQTVRVWDAGTGARLAVLRGHEGFVTSAAFSPDGRRIVSASDDKTIRIWDSGTGAQIAVLHGHEDFVNSAVFSSDGRRIVSASDDNTARVWDAGTGTVIAVLRGHEGYVTSAAFSPDGRRVVTTSWDRTVRVWDAGSGAQIAVLRGHSGYVFDAAFSPDGQWIVSAAGDQTVRVWGGSSGEQIVLRGHEGSVNSAAFAPDGLRIVSASADKTARVWDLPPQRGQALIDAARVRLPRQLTEQQRQAEFLDPAQR